MLHNETVNIWTHVLGFLYICCLAGTNSPWGRNPLASDPPLVYRWPIQMYLAGAGTCLLLSSACHLLGCCREHVARVVWRFDYVGIAIHIASSHVPIICYSFLCMGSWRIGYLLMSLLLGSAAVAVCLLEFFQTHSMRHMRALTFVGMAAFAWVPLSHRWYIDGGSPRFWEAVMRYLAMAAMGCFSAIVYSARLPERLSPGRFDLALHSHNIFHVCCVAAIYLHYQACLAFIRWREAEPCSA